MTVYELIVNEIKNMGANGIMDHEMECACFIGDNDAPLCERWQDCTVANIGKVSVWMDENENYKKAREA